VVDETVARNLQSMDELDFAGWNGADWEGVFTRYHTDDVIVDVHGQAPTHGIGEHIQAMKAFVESTGGAPVQVKSGWRAAAEPPAQCGWRSAVTCWSFPTRDWPIRTG
jgi:hypothetical protein